MKRSGEVLSLVLTVLFFMSACGAAAGDASTNVVPTLPGSSQAINRTPITSRTNPPDPSALNQEGGVMHITVQVQPDVAADLRQQQTSTLAAQDLISTLSALGVQLEPLHPDTTDPNLATYFTVAVPDIATAERVVKRLQQSTAVDSAYLKPSDELP